MLQSNAPAWFAATQSKHYDVIFCHRVLTVLSDADRIVRGWCDRHRAGRRGGGMVVGGRGPHAGAECGSCNHSRRF